jgi:hypothetical protein
MSQLDDRCVAVGIAKRQLLVVAVLAELTSGQIELVRELQGRPVSSLSFSAASSMSVIVIPSRNSRSSWVDICASISAPD